MAGPVGGFKSRFSVRPALSFHPAACHGAGPARLGPFAGESGRFRMRQHGAVLKAGAAAHGPPSESIPNSCEFSVDPEF